MPNRLEPNARSIAAHVVERVEKEGAFAAAVLDAAVDRFAELDPRERALATELTYGALRTGPYLEQRLLKYASRGTREIETTVRAHLVVAGYQLLFLDRVPAFAAVSEAVRLVTQARGKRVGAFANALLRRLAAEPTGDKRAALEQATRASVAAPLWEALARSLGDAGASAFLAATATPPVVLRVRLGEGGGASLAQLVESRATWIDRLAAHAPRASFEQGALSPLAVLMRGGGDPQKIPFYRDGALAIHEEGAQVIALALGAAPGETVLDACAGRGNKTALLAEMVGPSGSVDAADQHPSKLTRLVTELERLKLRPRATYAVDWTVGPGDTPAEYDRVLVDAPCSGTGTLRRRPDLAARWDASKLPELRELQVKVLLGAAARVKVGGLVVYAVCSVLREECEDVVAMVLARAPWLVQSTLCDRFVPALGGVHALRLTPQDHGTDGYYLAALQRRS
jgi:16S rRNA (cytosine967-C5)-methyltransferase